MSVFSDYMERGYSAIPIAKMGKYPMIQNWQVYSERLPTNEEAEKWDEQFTGFNIGIVCGKASGIVVLDIDTDNQQILDLCPRSPVVRRGAKGEARFFKYSDNIPSRSIPMIDIISTGRQIVIPPSIHPVTKKPYTWTTIYKLDGYDKDDLPELNIDFLDEASRAIAQLSEIKGEGGIKIKSGRNNKLVDIVTAMRTRGEAESDIIIEVYNWDKNFHSPRLFFDISEGYKAKNEDDAKLNAWKFVNNVTSSLIRNGAAVFQHQSPIIVVNESSPMAIERKMASFTRPSGVMGKIMTLIEGYSERDMPNLALGGAVSLMSAICCNRFKFADTWPNTYVLNLAPTGAGKSFPQRVIKKILEEKLSTGLLGFGNYRSSSALTKNLVTKRERLDVIDEVASLFAQMKSGGLYQTEILDELCKLWSDSNTKYMASEYAEREDTATCYNPCINILGSSTIDGIKTNISKSTTVKGLMPRFLIFAHEEYGKIKEDKLDHELLDEVCQDLGMILEIDKPISKEKVDVRHGPMYSPIDLYPKEKGAIKYFNEIKLEFAMSLEQDIDESLRHMLTRGKEQVIKLAIIHAVSNLRFDGVILEDLVWAKETYDTCIHNSKFFIQETNVENEYEKNLTQIENFIIKKGKVTESQICNYIRKLPKKLVKDVLQHLISMDRIQLATMEVKSNKKVIEIYIPKVKEINL